MTNPALLRREQERRVVNAPQGKEKRPPVLGSSVKWTIDYRNQSAINYRDRSHRCQARSLSVVAYRQAGAIRNDHTGNLREAIAMRPRVSLCPWAKLGVFGAGRPSSTGSGGGNSEIIRGRCAERQIYVNKSIILRHG